jgi:hypothetical protein
MNGHPVDLYENPISIDSLPVPRTRVRWTANLKCVVVRAVQHGIIPLSHAIQSYRLSEEEFDSWTAGLAAKGKNGLLITKRERNSQPPPRHT